MVNRSDLIVSPHGLFAALREPANEILPSFRLGTGTEFCLMQLGYNFPWGNLPNDERASQQWREARIGVSGLVHREWFRTTNGRYGGAENVVTTGPGAVRYCLYADGGDDCQDYPKENEGYFLVQETDSRTRNFARRLAQYNAQFVGADGGRIIMSLVGDDGHIYVAFTGRCLKCPNQLAATLPQLQSSFPDFTFEVFPWQLPFLQP